MNNSVKSTGTLVQWIRNNPHCLAMLYFVFYLIAFFSLEQLRRPDLHISASGSSSRTACGFW